ncbi:hypothetical protein MBLNU230_g7919t1 [Neophaeotheca triangularis]
MAGKTGNPLVATDKPDTSLSVQLHPLVLLTISDYVTRHTLREQEGSIFGAIIGSQSGRNFTLEHAYECTTNEAGDEIKVDAEFFHDRLEQYKEVHKAAALDLVGVFMLAPADGPSQKHVDVVRQVQQISGNDNILLLLFQPELVETVTGGRLPIGLYESSVEQGQDAGEESMRFKELSFEVETAEAEMIGVDFVAKGGGNATAIPGTQSKAGKAEAGKTTKTPMKGKGKAKAEEEQDLDTDALSSADEELIASLTAKANAVKMLKKRIDVIRNYLESQPSSYLTDASSDEPPRNETNHQILRSILALLSRLPLLTPPSNVLAKDSSAPAANSSLAEAGLQEKADVHLTSLLAALTRATHEAQGMGNKFHMVQKERSNKFSGGGGSGGFRGPAGGAGFPGAEPMGNTLGSSGGP